MAIDCTIKASNLVKVYGSGTPLTAQLLNNNTPLAGKTVVITINGKSYNRVTGSDGKVSLNINLLPGDYSTTIKFNGDSTYNPTTTSVVVKVLRNDTPQQQTKGEGNYFEVNKIPLWVILDDGFSTTMGTDVKITELLKNNSTLNAPSFYFNSGDHGVEFDISIIIWETHYYNDLKVADYLNMWNKNLTPVSVVTDAMDVPNSKYIMSIKSKKQTSKMASIWKLHFRQYYENQLSFENMYTDKVSTLSAQDQILVRYNLINENSPKEAILALQQKLMWKGAWNNKQRQRKPNGVWTDEMPFDIALFQFKVFGGDCRKNGVCDRDTINALLDETYNGDGPYYSGLREFV